jgi:serralysin
LLHTIDWPVRAGLTVLVVVGGGLFAAPAQAATTGVASVVGTTVVRYHDGTSHANNVVVTRSGNTITIDDRFVIKAGKGCKAVKGDKTRVRCTPSKAPLRVRVLVDYGNDSVVNRTDLPISVYGGLGNDRIVGGPGNDRLLGNTGRDRIWGMGGDDHLDGYTGGDVLSGGDGHDGLYGWWGTDTIYGGSGDDFLDGFDGHDRLYGGTGGDRLLGSKGADRLEGGAGNDSLHGDDERAGGMTVSPDILLGGPGVDQVGYGSHTKAVYVDLDGATGDDGQAGERDTVGADVENLVGGPGSDRLTGNAANNYITGEGGDDVVRAGAGDDFVIAYAGADQIYGEAGDDLIFSGEDGRQIADRIDGGTHGELGDECQPGALDTVVNCER